ncbi:hypothetical protein Pmani_012631 [Petrolisthes manimaculis]|uniref:C2H2-type domain-containing protein n=1 Tax=Petrolisthes manimaculis TaxID=1843537 RepID=A0AAE1Q0A6_9EUCA|nr:hypothetical protein Pmani_012631 [Petrolisthes manimaculis]
MAEGGVQARPGGAECLHCLRVFRTLAGMRLHERKAHPEFYHEEERHRKDAQPRKQWSVEELTLLSQFELDHSDLRPGELVSLAKQTLFPGRTLDSLRCQRKSHRFRTILEAGSPRPVLSPRPPVPAGSPPVVTGAQTVRAGTPPVVPVRERRPQNLNASRRCASTLEAEGESNLPPLVQGVGRRRAQGDDERVSPRQTPGNIHADGGVREEVTVPGPGAGAEEYTATRALVWQKVVQLSRALQVKTPSGVEDLESQLRIWFPGTGKVKDRGERSIPRRGDGDNLILAEEGEVPVGAQRVPRRMLRRRRYVVCQKGWKKNRGRIAKKIISGQDMVSDEPAPMGVMEAWVQEFSKESIPVQRGPIHAVYNDKHEIMAPIISSELERSLRSMNAKAAPGWDGVTVASLRDPAKREQLFWLLNGAIFMEDVPEAWKRGQTTLIPKDSHCFTILNGVELRALGPNSFYRYLGIETGATLGSPGVLLTRYRKGLNNINRAPLKPQQKLWCATEVLQPQLQYPLLHGEVKKGWLKRFDVETRKTMRKIMHLPPDTPLGFFFSSPRACSLGVKCFTTGIPASREWLAKEGFDLDELPKSAPSDSWDSDWWNSVDGAGCRGSATLPSFSGWVRAGTRLMSGGEFVSAIKLRGNVLSTRSREARGRPERPVLCRHGCQRPETLGHIQQSCPVTHGWRVQRHDKIVTTVCADMGVATPNDAHERKRHYYNTPIIRQWVNEQSGKPPVISSIVMNWQGAWAQALYNTKALGGTDELGKLISVRMLEDSVRMYRMFCGAGALRNVH